jgi:glutathione synthase/RimK-type ligase-like ATP-grasp enzyme
MIFHNARWVNHPNATYFAEQKAVQLATANDLGFVVPATLFTNDAIACAELFPHKLVMKGIDTVIAYQDNREYFAFVEPLDPKDLVKADLSAIPVTIQRAVNPKIDLRVTVVADQAYAVEIKANGAGISGDWRKHKQHLTYNAIVLPQSIEHRCIELTAKLGLSFSGIDLARVDDAYIFFEINPTGEWSWLVDSAGLPIDEAIADVLLQ